MLFCPKFSVKPSFLRRRPTHEQKTQAAGAGHAYGIYTNLAYKLATGKTAGQLRKDRGVGKEAAIAVLLDAGLCYDSIKTLLSAPASPELTKNLSMIADDSCYTVGIPRQTADKGVVLGKPTYYTTAAQVVQGALNRAMRQAVKDSSITTLRKFIQEQDRQLAELEKLIAPLNSGEK